MLLSGQNAAPQADRSAAGALLDLPRALIGQKHEQLVFLDGPAGRNAELILIQDAALDSRAVRKEVVRVQHGVPKVLKQRSVDDIGPRFRDDVDVGAGIAPIAGVEL
jgi:hypothetical protein